MTESTESITVFRPIKIVSLVCGILGVILLIIAIATSYWLETEDYKEGLWDEDKSWVVACAALCIISLLCTSAGVVLNLLGLILKSSNTKKYCYLAAMCVFFAAILCLVIGLCVFPAMFMQEVDERNEGDQWYFGWSYGVAWGAAIFIFGAAILLLVDKENDTIYYKEKTYDTPHSTA